MCTVAGLTFLTLYHNEGPSVLNRVVTGDKQGFTITFQRKNDNQCIKKKGKVKFSACKVMATAFWDNEEVLLVRYLEHGETVTSDYYCNTLRRLRTAIRHKRTAICHKRPEKFPKKSSVLLFHDNARPRTAKKTQDLLKKLGWTVFNHPPYSPDIAPSDYHLFRFLKTHLGGRQFETNEDVTKEVTNWLQKNSTEFYALGIEKLVNRYNKCLNRLGDYVEK